MLKAIAAPRTAPTPKATSAAPTLTGFRLDPGGVSVKTTDGGSVTMAGTFKNGGDATLRWNRALAERQTPAYNVISVTTKNGTERPLTGPERADLAAALGAALQQGTVGQNASSVASALEELKKDNVPFTLGPNADFKNPRVAAYLNDPGFRSLPFNFSDKNFSSLSGQDMARILDVPLVKQNPGAFVREMMLGPSGLTFDTGIDALTEVARALGKVGDAATYALFSEATSKVDGQSRALPFMEEAFNQARPDSFSRQSAAPAVESARPAPDEHAALASATRSLWD